MGLAAELGYEHPERARAHRVIHGVLRVRQVSALLRFVTAPVDRAVLFMSRRRVTASDVIAGLPPLWLTTTGARSGAPRTTPLYGIPVKSEIAVMGTGFGQKKTPDWVYNLEADPRAEVSYNGRSLPVVARLPNTAEELEIWETAAVIYPGYRNYRRWATHRRIRVFVLELSQ